MNNKVRNILIYAGIVAFFLVLAYAFVPEVLSGKIVNQSDITGFKGMSREASVWNASHPDDPARWTGSMFGGMPTTSFMPSSEGDWTQGLYDLMMTGKRPATWLFISLLGAFLLMLSLGIYSVNELMCFNSYLNALLILPKLCSIDVLITQRFLMILAAFSFSSFS